LAEITVVIPVYNRADRLPQAVASVLEQSGPPLELIVVDDGSEDDVQESLKRFAGDTRLQILRQSQSGVSRARNHGVRLGSGEWIAFLDSDDIWMPGKLSAQMGAMRHSGDSINQTQEIWIRHGRRVNPPVHAVKKGGDIFLPSLRHCMITPSSVLMSRRLFEESGGFDETFPACEDYDLWLRITCKYKVGLVEKPLLTRHGGHADQLSAKYPAMDRFRVQALLKWLAANPTDFRRDAVLEVLGEKLRILGNGYRKRNNAEGIGFCRDLARRHSMGIFTGV
jgi:glycosyltransferase involved in cell wall biosynthesis